MAVKRMTDASNKTRSARRIKTPMRNLRNTKTFLTDAELRAITGGIIEVKRR